MHFPANIFKISCATCFNYYIFSRTVVVSELWGEQCVRLKVTAKTDNCGESAECSGKGVCYSNLAMEEYECQCCSGFAGPHCEEIDACTPSPCTNNGICVDLSQGHEGNSYQCLCPYGKFNNCFQLFKNKALND